MDFIPPLKPVVHHTPSVKPSVANLANLEPELPQELPKRIGDPVDHHTAKESHEVTIQQPRDEDIPQRLQNKAGPHEESS